MNRVVNAIQTGRCTLAVSGSLLNDPDVLLALRDRASMPAVALSGPAVAPVQAIGDAAISRVVNAPGGVLVLVNPQTSDMPGIQKVAELLGKGAHKPQVLVVSPAYNPLMFASALRGVAIAHLKARPKEFITKELPMPPAEAPAVEGAPADKKAKASTGGPDAPRFAFVGREEELATLQGFLGEAGPIVVAGPAGIGKTWLVEHAVAASGLTRLPDMVLGWGTGADALAARIAEIAREGGAPALHDLLKGPHTSAQVTEAAIASLQAATGTEGKVFVVHDLHHAMGREGDFFRKSRLEMLIVALLTHSYPLRIVFMARQQPIFHRERAGDSLRRLSLAGLKGRFLFEIFDAYKAPEFPRDKFGPISEKIHGHPLAARAYAIEVRDRQDGLALLEDPKFLRMEDARDLAPVKKLLERKVEKLGREERGVLALVAHFRLPVTGQMMSDLGIGRRARLQLLADGLLDMVGTAEDKRYTVHPVVRSTLSLRETSEFETLGRVAEMYGRMAQAATGVEKLALMQETNRNATTARLYRNRFPTELPDDDALLESVAGLIRSKQPHFEMAHERITDVLKRNPANADAWILRLEALARADADKDVIEGVIAEAAEKAPVPELFHQVVSWYVQRRARGKATTVLERAIELLPDESRLRTRLAALLLRQGRRKEAIDHLRKAMELDPMLPDAYGLLGTARRDEGADALDEAETLLREAVRLAPGDATQISRLVDLLIARGAAGGEGRETRFEQAKELLETVLKSDRKTADAYLLYAQLLREEGKDLERAGWMLKKARKLTERGSERVTRIILENALQELRRGELDAAEKEIRELAVKEPSNDRVFAALAQILEAKQLYIPAHAEYLRARERTPKASLERQRYDGELARLQALIEAQVAGMVASGEVQLAGGVAAEPAKEPSVTGHARIIRRRKTAAEAAADGGTEGDEVSAEQAAAEAAAEGGDVEGEVAEGEAAEGEEVVGSQHLYDDAESDAPAGGDSEGAEASASED